MRRPTICDSLTVYSSTFSVDVAEVPQLTLINALADNILFMSFHVVHCSGMRKPVISRDMSMTHRHEATASK